MRALLLIALGSCGLQETGGGADHDHATLGAGNFERRAAQRAGSTAGIVIALAVDANGVDQLMTVEGTVKVTVAGNLELWMASENTNTLTVKAGSSLVVTKVQ